MDCFSFSVTETAKGKKNKANYSIDFWPDGKGYLEQEGFTVSIMGIMADEIVRALKDG